MVKGLFSGTDLIISLNSLRARSGSSVCLYIHACIAYSEYRSPECLRPLQAKHKSQRDQGTVAQADDRTGAHALN